MKKILITGGSGFIGTNLVEYYLQHGFQVINIDNMPPRNRHHQALWKPCDILDKADYLDITSDFSPDVFIHLAARTDLDGSTLEAYRANTLGVENTIEVIQRTKSIVKAVFASSRMVCRIDHIPKDEFDYCPPNPYGESKMIGERLVRQAHLNCSWIIVRPTSIWGPWFDVPYKIFFNTIRHGKYFHPGSFDPNKSFGYVGNTVYEIDRIVSLLDEHNQGKTLYLCDYPTINVKKWANQINSEFGRPPIRSVPYVLLKLAAVVGDCLSFMGIEGFPITSFRLNNLITTMVYDTSELESICGPLPFSQQEGVTMTVAYMQQTEPIHSVQHEVRSRQS